MSTGTVALPPKATEVPGPPRALSRPDARFFPHTGYRDAYARLLDGLCQDRGLLVLTGEAGTGKTLLLRNLSQDTTVRLNCAFCGSTHLDFDNLLTHLCDQFQLPTRGPARSQQRAALQDYLTTCAEQGITVVVLIDEAHHLRPEVLHPLLTLAEPRLEGGHRLQLVLSGLPRLADSLRQPPDLPPVVAKAVHVRLEPLRAAELTAFIHWQWQRTEEPSTANRLSVPVIDRIARYTGGIPRLISMLCERAHWLAQLDGHTTVSAAIIDEAAGKLMLPPRPTVQEQESGLIPHGNEPVRWSRKHRWTVTGTAVLALLALAVQVWFPLDRPPGATEAARPPVEVATPPPATAEAARPPVEVVTPPPATAEVARPPVEAATPPPATAEAARPPVEAATPPPATAKNATREAPAPRTPPAARRLAQAAPRRPATASRQRSPQRWMSFQAPRTLVDQSRALILSIFPRED